MKREGEMTEKVGKRLIEAAQEALTIAKGEKAAASITINGHRYIPHADYEAMQRERDVAYALQKRTAEVLDEWKARAEGLDRNLTIAWVQAREFLDRAETAEAALDRDGESE